MCNPRDNWAFGLCLSSGILKNSFWKLDVFPSSDERVGDTLLSSPLEGANFNLGANKKTWCSRTLTVIDSETNLISIITVT
jgi:hypothetical protein